MNSVSPIAAHTPTPWPRYRNRQRFARIPIGDKRRICGEFYRDSNDVEVICLWSEVSEGRNWRQVGHAFPMPARALELLLGEYWQWGDDAVIG